MGGWKVFAIGVMLATGALVGSPAFADEDTPIVSLRQPISLVSHHSCDCNACDAGLPCCATVPPLALPSALCDTDLSCDSSGSPACHQPAACGCGVVEPSCGTADGATCDGCSSCDSPSTIACDNGSCVKKHCDILSYLDCKGECGGKCIECCCVDLCQKSGFWIRADTLLWWTNDNDTPTLATTSTAGTPLVDAGVLGLPSTSTLYDGPLFGDMRIGGRLRYGYWADECKHGFEGSVWGLLNQDDMDMWQSEGDPIIARPFVNSDPDFPGPNAQLVAFPDVLRGNLTISSWSEIVGTDAGVRKLIKCCSDPCGCSSERLDAYLGYRSFHVNEGLRISENLESTALGGATALGTTIDLFDQFETTNTFHGGVLGLIHQRQNQRWSSEFIGRLALGNLNRQASIQGETTVTVPTVSPVTRAGGLLAQPTNIGRYEDNEFVVLPEVQYNLLYNLTCHTKFVVGYTAMYLGDVVRPGDIVNTTVNGLQLDPTLTMDGPEDPSFAWNDSSMWLMGLSLGVEFDF